MNNIFFDASILSKSLDIYKKGKNKDICLPISTWFLPVKNMVESITVFDNINLQDVFAIASWLSIPPIKSLPLVLYEKDEDSHIFSNTKKLLIVLLFKKLFTVYKYNRIVENLFHLIGDQYLPIIGCCYPFEKENEYFTMDFDSLTPEKNILLKNYIWLSLRESAEKIYKKYPPFLYETPPFPIVITDEFQISSLP
jgi:hypothetical protein